MVAARAEVDMATSPRERAHKIAHTVDLAAETERQHQKMRGEASDKTEDEVSRRAQDLHNEMRTYWNQQYDGAYYKNSCRP